MNNYVVGADFGTTNSCLSWFNTESKQVQVIPNQQGNFTTPSILFLNNESSEILFGESASQLLHSNNNQLYLSNIFSNLKRLIGNINLTDNLKECFKHNNLQLDSNNKLSFKLNFNNQEKEFDIKTLITFYLNHLKNILLNHFGTSNTNFNIVLTVPAYFDDYQRTFLKECCESIGFIILRIINEPTAASLAYALDKYKNGNLNEEYILTFDCGGGTTDISLLHLDYIDSIYEVKNTIGNNFLGGEDITNNLTNYIISKLNLQNGSTKYYNKIKRAAEVCKKLLSFNQSHTIILELADQDYTLNITQTQFNEINKEFYSKIKNLIYYVLDDYISKNNDFNYSKINSIIFVGGTTRIPYFKTLFQNIFPNAYINNTIDPDQTISIGASIQGALLKNLIDQDSGGDTLLMDILPLSIGIETIGGIMTPIISRNSMIPISRTQQFTNSDSFEKIITINVYQGERKFVIDNSFLTSFQLESDLFQNYDKGEITVSITFHVDTNSIITAKAIAKISDTELISEIQVTKEHNTLNQKELDEILYYSEMNKLIDNEMSNKILAKLELYDSFKNLLSVFHEKYHHDNSDKFVISELNNLFNHTFNVIQTFQDYSPLEINNIKELFEKKWHTLLFDKGIILKDDNRLIIEFGGTTLDL